MESNDANALLNDMREVRRHVVDEGEALVARWQPMIRRQAFAGSARNLAHYLAFRQLDLRPLQAALAPWGLASLSRKEGRLLPSLNAIIANLEVFSRVNEETERPTVEDSQRGTEALAENTAAIFGPDRDDRRAPGSSSPCRPARVRSRSSSAGWFAPAWMRPGSTAPTTARSFGRR